MKTGWLLENGAWYYLNADGKKQAGLLEYDGKEYNLDSNGKLESNNNNAENDEQEIWLPPTLYNYDTDSEKYSISSQNILVNLSQQWFDAETTEDKHEIERRLLYFRYNIPSDSYINKKYEEGTNEVLAGAIGQLALNSAGASKDVLNGKINALGTSKGDYIIGQVSSADSENVRVYHVEGSINERIIIGENGDIAIEGTNKTLFLNFGDADRANEFLAKRLGQGMKDVSIKSFQVPQSYFEEIKSQVVPESDASLYADRPIEVDTTKAENQFELRPDQIKALEQEIIENSGEISEVPIE